LDSYQEEKMLSKIIPEKAAKAKAKTAELAMVNFLRRLDLIRAR